MKRLPIEVVEMQSDDALYEQAQLVCVAIYEDGSIEIPAILSGMDHSVHLKFHLADLVKLAMLNERQEAP